MVSFRTKLGTDCYDYKVTVNWNENSVVMPTSLRPYGESDVQITVQAIDSSNPSSSWTQQLTRAFQSLGDNPSLVLKNGTHSFTFDSDEFTVSYF